jgi:uncharacterized membrane protein (DUF485 family)
MMDWSSFFWGVGVTVMVGIIGFLAAIIVATIRTNRARHAHEEATEQVVSRLSDLPPPPPRG